MIIENKARAIATDIDMVQELMNELDPKRCSTLMRKIRKQVPNYQKRDDCEEVTLHLDEHEAKFLRAVIGDRHHRQPLRGGPRPPTVERTKR